MLANLRKKKRKLNNIYIKKLTVICVQCQMQPSCNKYYYYYYYNLFLSMLIILRTYVVNAKSTHQLQQTPLFKKT